MKTTASQGMKLMFVRLGLALVSSAAALPASAVMIADFETSSGYSTAGANVTFVGTEGWRRGGGGNDTYGTLTPNSTSGYTFVMAGSQSAYAFNSWFQKSFASESITAGDIAAGEISWLQATPDTLASGQSQGLYIIANSSGNTQAGIFARNVGGVRTIWLAGSTEVDSGISYAIGGGGAPNLNTVYQFSMTFDFTAHTMTGYYQNITGGGTKTLLGSVGINNALTAATVATDFGVGLYTSGGVVGFDNIEINAVPEPSSVALAGLGVAALLMRFRRLREQA